MNRLLQDQRKVLNLKISDRIEVRVAAPPHIAKAVTAHEAFLRNELLAEKLELGAVPNDAVKLLLGGEEILVSISPVHR